MPIKDKQKRAEYNRKYSHSEKGKLVFKKSLIKRKDKILDYKRRYFYGINYEQFNNILINQNYVCAICLKKEKIKQNGNIKLLAIDHDHNTGKIRGLLCHHCNTILGLCEDSIYILDRAKDYLLKNQ